MSKPIKDVLIDVPENIIKELLTESEFRMVKQRLMIVRLLSEGETVRAIAKKVGVGTDTVVRISKKLEGSPLLKDYYKKSTTTLTSTWVFGQGSKRTT